MQSRETIAELARIDIANERVLLTCPHCKRLRGEYKRTELVRMLTCFSYGRGRDRQPPKGSPFPPVAVPYHSQPGFDCYDCRATTLFPMDLAHLWVETIMKGRTKVLDDWYGREAERAFLSKPFPSPIYSPISITGLGA